jgi:hypothetical protein
MHISVTVAELAYLAGIIDGEGCIGLRLPGPSVTPSVRIEVTNTDRRLISWLSDRFGGYSSGPVRPTNSKLAYRWTLAKRDDVRSLLEAMLPYLVIKDRQASLALEFFSNCPPLPQGPAATQEERILRLHYLEQMSLLNRKGVV